MSSNPITDIHLALELLQLSLHARIDKAAAQAHHNLRELTGTYEALASWYWYAGENKARRIAEHRAALLREFPDRARLTIRACMKGQP